jgi:hypothetical protein
MRSIQGIRRLEAVTAEGHVVEPGSTITDRHGITYEYRYATRPTEPDKSGKVVVVGPFSDEECESYAHLFGVTVRNGGTS